MIYCWAWSIGSQIKELQNARGRKCYLEWISTRQGTACEAPSSVPQSRLLFCEVWGFFCFRVGGDEKPLYWSSYESSAQLSSDNKYVPLQRPFICSVDDCHSSYRRKDHLTRHMLQHEGKLFECTFDGCKKIFTLQGNMTRHVKEFHDESASAEVKQHFCSEHGCGKVFKYLSKLKKHEDSHGKLLLFWLLCNQVIVWW